MTFGFVADADVSLAPSVLGLAVLAALAGTLVVGAILAVSVTRIRGGSRRRPRQERGA